MVVAMVAEVVPILVHQDMMEQTVQGVEMVHMIMDGHRIKM